MPSNLKMLRKTNKTLDLIENSQTFQKKDGFLTLR